jgi:hypothetical protein
MVSMEDNYATLNAEEQTTIVQLKMTQVISLFSFGVQGVVKFLALPQNGKALPVGEEGPLTAPA